MHCGPGARLVSCDRFFNHISRMDPLMKAQFRRWQNLNQMVLEKFVGSEPVFVVISFFFAISCMNRPLSLSCHYGFETRLESRQSLKYIIYFQIIAFCLSSLISNPKWRLCDKSLLVSLEGFTCRSGVRPCFYHDLSGFLRASCSAEKFPNYPI